MSIQLSHQPTVVYRYERTEDMESFTHQLGQDLAIHPAANDDAARRLIAKLGDTVTAVIIDQVDLNRVIDSPLLSQIQQSCPHSLNILLHDTLSLDAVSALLKTRTLSKCFAKPCDFDLIRSDIYTAHLRVATPASMIIAEPSAMPSVLLIDDEPSGTKYLKKQLERSADGFRILTASSAAEALALLRQDDQDIAVIITDQRMPGMTGNALLNDVKRSHPHIIRVLTSAFHEVDVALGAVNEGQIYQYLKKPWNADEVLTCIRSALAQFNHLRSLSEQNRDAVQDQHKAILRERVNRIITCMPSATLSLLDHATLMCFLRIMNDVEVLPPTFCSIQSSTESALELELVEALRHALVPELSLLHAELASNSGQELIQALRDAIETEPVNTSHAPASSDFSAHVLKALYTLLLASGLCLDDVQIVETTEAYQIELKPSLHLAIYTHLLAPLRRVTKQLVAQQASLLIVMSAISLLGGNMTFEPGKQSLRFTITLPKNG